MIPSGTTIKAFFPGLSARTIHSMNSPSQTLTLRAKELLVELAGISLEIAQMAITPEDGETLPAWFIVEVTRDLPALTKKKMG